MSRNDGCEAAAGCLPLILASASPRRVRLLRQAGVEFEQVPARIDESALVDESPEAYVVRLAEEKARAVWRRGTRALGADTAVVIGSKVLGKPEGPSHARRMLRMLSGRTHRVLTGIALFDGDSCDTLCEETQVRFRRLHDGEIDAYVASGDPLDKAGSYGIQGEAARFVESVSGSRSNVVGLPVETVVRVLR